MSKCSGGGPIVPLVREFLGMVKKAPDSVLKRLNEIAAEISELDASKAKDEESLRDALDAMERAREQRARLRELRLATLENERKAILLVVNAYETHLYTPVPDAQQIPHTSAPDQIVTVLSQSNEPLTRQQIADQLPDSTVNSVSTMLSRLKATGLVQKIGNRRWQIR